MNFETLWETLEPTAISVANRYGSKCARYGADREDFLQELTVWVFQNMELLTTKAEEIGDDAQFIRWVARAFDNEARDYRRDIKSQSLGYERRDEFFFSRGEVKALLPAMFDPEAWLNPPQSDGRTAKTPAEGNNWATTLADLSSAYDKLDGPDRVLLAYFHKDGFTNKELSEAYEVTESTMSYRHDMAVKRLVDHLGGELPRPSRPSHQYDPWRGRHAVSNAAARAYQDSLYEEA